MNVNHINAYDANKIMNALAAETAREEKNLIDKGYRGFEILFTKNGDVSGFIHNDKEVLLRKVRFPNREEIIEVSDVGLSFDKRHTPATGNVVSAYVDVHEAKTMIDEYLQKNDSNSSKLNDKISKSSAGNSKLKKVASHDFKSQHFPIRKSTVSAMRTSRAHNMQEKMYENLWNNYKDIVQDYYTTSEHKREGRTVDVKDLRKAGGLVGYAVVLPEIKNKNRRLISKLDGHRIDIARLKKGFKFKFDTGVKRKIPLLTLKGHPDKDLSIIPPKRGVYARSKFSKSMDIHDAFSNDDIGVLQIQNIEKDKIKIEKERQVYGKANQVLIPQRRTTHLENPEPIFEDDEGYLRDYYNYMKDIDDNDNQAIELPDQDIYEKPVAKDIHKKPAERVLGKDRPVEHKINKGQLNDGPPEKGWIQGWVYNSLKGWVKQWVPGPVDDDTARKPVKQALKGPVKKPANEIVRKPVKGLMKEPAKKPINKNKPLKNKKPMREAWDVSM